MKIFLVCSRYSGLKEAIDDFSNLESKLRKHEIGLIIERYLETGNKSFLDKAARKLMNNIPEPWTTLERL